MEERYIRNLGALTEAECALLREKTVLVAGCGGLGGYLIEMLPQYYAVRGWVNAFPTDETLKKLGLDECVGK